MPNGSMLFSWNNSFDNNMMDKFCEFLFTCKREDKDAILLLSSNGGSSSAMFAACDTLRATKVHLTVIGRGLVASAAAVLFCMGDERILLPSAELLIHNGRNYYRESTTLLGADMEEQAERMRKYDDMAMKLVCEKTKITPEVYQEKCGKREDWLLTPEDLEKYGVTTEPYSDQWVDIVLEAMKSSKDK